MGGRRVIRLRRYLGILAGMAGLLLSVASTVYLGDPVLVWERRFPGWRTAATIPVPHFEGERFTTDTAPFAYVRIAGGLGAAAIACFVAAGCLEDAGGRTGGRSRRES